jgi:HNH endonuclease
MTSKNIPSFPRYTISENSEIYDTKNERIVSQSNNKYGYKNINLYDADNIRKIRFVHRLVYEAFGLIEGGIMPDEIDHIDGNPLNNLIGNLRPATSQENKRNTKIRKDNNSGHKNIWITHCGTYEVRVKITADVRYNKNHKTLELAIADATRVRNEYHGHFVNHG